MNRLALLVAMVACGGDVGVITIELSEDPGGNILASTDRVRLSLDNPPTVTEATRQPGGGIALDLEIDATGVLGRVALEAFDASGVLIGVAESGPLPLNAIDGVLNLYVGAPLSIGVAPIALEPPRTDIAVAPLSFGAALLGGQGSGGPVDNVVVYNVYDHDFQLGEDLPAPRSGAAAAASNSGLVYVFGGSDGVADIATPLAFDTNVAPAGRFVELSTTPGLERSGAQAAILGGENVVISGDPVVVINGASAEALSGPGIIGTLTGSTLAGAAIAVGVGLGTAATGAAIATSQSTTELSGPGDLLRTNHAATAEDDGDVFVVGGIDEGAAPLLSGLRYNADRGDFSTLDDLLAAPRLDPAVAITDRYIVVAGGTDELGAVLADALVIDRNTLATVATLPLNVGRTRANAVALVNNQVLIFGGRDSAGSVIATMELFTPDL